MAKKLIIAEKPSVAADIARALGGFARKSNYFESDDFVISSAVGHLLQLAVPDEYDVKKGKWSFARLPVIPPYFDLAPIDRSEDRLNLLMRLIKRKDIEGLVNACDAGREGELIFRYLAQHAKTKKSIERLWLQSMTPQAIRDGFSKLRQDTDLLPLADAAKSRSEADWLVGINGTRAMTAFNSKEGGFYLTTVGRVQTPTLTILVEREEKIRAFTPRNYWEVHARFRFASGEYPGKWFDPDFRKSEADPDLRAERILTEQRAVEIAAASRNGAGRVTDETKPQTQASPLLFDLTSLQREANGRFGFSAKATLSIAQSLYERHKVLTYPRTDSRALPEDYIPTVKKTLEALADLTAYAPHAREIRKQGWVKPNKRVFDNSKISDHFAIIPTLQTPAKPLSEPEQKIYDMVVRRFLAIFFPSAQYLQTVRITEVNKEHFRTEGRILKDPGWLTVYGRTVEEDNQNLPMVDADEKVMPDEVTVQALQTKPPPRFSEATLLSAMEGAGKLIEDDELRAAMEAKGLGTPATRAAVIEGLIQEEYLHRNQRELVPTPKAFSLLFALRHFGVSEITSPELTGDWEFKLKQMEAGKLKREEFMEHIEQVTRDMVERIRNGEIPDTAFATVRTPCPKCGGAIQENYRKFQCQKCDFSLWKVVSGREWDVEEVAQLIEARYIGPLTGFRSKMGKPFSAAIKLNDESRLEFDFGQSDSDNEAPPDFSGREVLGTCPACSANVYDNGVAYVCEKAVGMGKTCNFRVSKIILQQPVEVTQLSQLLSTGKTDLLPRFISKRGRPFKAFLVKQPGGKIGFEFQAPKGRVAAPKAAAAASKAAVTENSVVKTLPSKSTKSKKIAAKPARKPSAKKRRSA